MARVHIAFVSLAAAFVAGLPLPSRSSPRAASFPGKEGPARETGELGTLPPQLEDVRIQDVLTHEDTHGGNLQALQALTGQRGGGLAAVWRDHRDGMMGLYLRRLDADGAGREAEAPIHAPHSGRRRDPAVALAGDGSGAVAWTSVFGGKNTVFLRTFDAKGGFTCSDLPLEAPPEARKAEAGERVRDSGDRQPSIAITGDGRVVVAWNRNGSALAQDFDAHGKARSAARVLNPGGDEASAAGTVRAVGLAKDAFCAWSTRDGKSAHARRVAGGKDLALGAGIVAAVCLDDSGDAWIALHDAVDARELRFVRIDAAGRVHAESARGIGLARTPQRVELAKHEGDLAIVVETAPGAENANTRRRGAPSGTSSNLQAWFARAGAEAELLPLDLLLGVGAPTTTDLRVASSGSAFVFAWTDEHERDPNVFARTFDSAAAPEARFGPLRRLNSDAASSDQTHARVAASGERAIVVWHDARDVSERIFARRIGSDGFTTPEFELPIDATRDAPHRPVRQLPEVALRSDGSFAVAWRDIADGAETLQLQLLDHEGRAVAPHIAVDPAQRTLGSLPCSLVALPDDRGYVMAWPRAGGTVWTRRVLLDGSFAMEPELVGAAKEAETPNTALCVLDDGRLVCTWDVQSAGRAAAASLRGRFLDREGKPEGEELVFEPSMFGKDWDPCVAPAAQGGFVMAWCAGAPNDPGRDVFARAFDAHGKPDGPFLPLTTMSNEQDWPSIARLDDGSWVVAWEDDLSRYDQTCARRILPNKRELGPARCMNQTETRSVPDRVLPAIAAWRGGFLGAWGDRRRSLGWDVYVRSAGPRFDGARKR